MCPSDNLLKKIQEELDKMAGDISLSDINALAGRVLEGHNNTPRQEAEGLSPRQIFGLVNSFLEGCDIVSLNPLVSVEMASTSSVVQICREILSFAVQEGKVKMTATGALPTRLVKSIADKFVLHTNWGENYSFSIHKESDSSRIILCRVLCEMAGYLVDGKGGKVLSQEGRVALSRPGIMLIELFRLFCLRFNWQYIDGFEKECGQIGVGYSLLLLHKYGGQWNHVTFYADKFLKAFPIVVDTITGDTEDALGKATYYYTLRTFEHGMEWFGLVHSDKKLTPLYHPDYRVMTTPLFREFIKVKWPK